MKIFNTYYIICFIFFSFLSCEKDDSIITAENEKLLFENQNFKAFNIQSNTTEIIKIKEYLALVERINKQKSIFNLQSLKSTVLKIKAFGGDINLFLWEITDESNIINGFHQKSYLLIGKNIINGNTNFNVYSVRKKNKIIIEEVRDLFTGTIHSYNLTGISDTNYLNLINYMEKKRTICFTSFKSCFDGLQESISENPEDSAVCSFLPCGAINYGVCAIASGSGYIQGNSNYIGDSRCDVIYDESGKNVKDNAE
ncbi:hypothetical protein LB456_08105 [Psychroflexus sp. CAK57W]|uniref:hypothetical protein n=1 Tax=Psychroflexus curvus TaxID=2873595 RepID=UPI001CCF4AF4|nr:hypothetical protein [Psychroflexus curvus]MBZ9787418.1 hypothetical protein [Psychroflexus curvus]